MPNRDSNSEPQAHPFKRVRLLLAGAIALSLAAGFVNSIALGYFEASVSHMTGAVSSLGMNLGEHDWRESVYAATIIGGFILGAVISGIVIGGENLVPGKPFGAAMICVGVLLALATALLENHPHIALPVISTACGLQNAMSTSYCGLMIRTTHITGTVTDIGMMIGNWIRHRKVDGAKLRFFVKITAAFALGCWFGRAAALRWGPEVLFTIAAIFLVVGITFIKVHALGLIDLVQPRPSPRPSSLAISRN